MGRIRHRVRVSIVTAIGAITTSVSGGMACGGLDRLSSGLHGRRAYTVSPNC